MATELQGLETGQRLGMQDTDWRSLLGLARLYWWGPSEGSAQYLPREAKRIVPTSEARALAGALEEALRDLPRERRREFRPHVGEPGGFVDETPRASTSAEYYVRYFSWGRRWIVEEVARLCRTGAVEIRPI